MSAVPVPDVAARPRVVVGLDGSEGSLAALRFARVAAAARGVPLVAVLASPAARHNPFTDFGHLPPSGRAQRRAVAEQLEALVAEHVPDGAVERHAAVGSPAGELLTAAAGADLLVVGSRGRGAVASLVLGSVSVQVVTHAQGPVAVVPPAGEHGAGADEGPRPVVVGIDGSQAAEAALQWAADDAAARGAPLRAVLAYDFLGQPDVGDGRAAFDPTFDHADAQLAAEALVARALGADAVVDVEAVLDLPTRALVEAGRDACQVVVGSRGRGGHAGLLLGSTSLGVLHRAACPVVVHR